MTEPSEEQERLIWRRKRVNRIKKWMIGIVTGWIIISALIIGGLVYHSISLNKRVISLDEKLVTSNEDTMKLFQDLNSKLIDDSGQITSEDASDVTNTYANLSGNEAVDSVKKQIYLTFDDGPSDNTSNILDVLDEYGVKGTFFVVGKTDEYSLDMYRRIVDEGHTIGLHSYSHSYNEIYSSIDAFNKDISKLSKLIKDTTDFQPNILRFPGGSSNEVSTVSMDELTKYIEEQGYTYYDWNVVSGDASSQSYTAEDLKNNVMDGIEKYQTSIVLFHDASNKDTTVEALRMILEQLKDQDVEILPINKDTKVIQHIHVEATNNN